MGATLNALLLLGWMPEQEAVEWLTNLCTFNPPLDGVAAKALWQQYHDKVEALPERVPQAPTQHPLPNNCKGHVTDFLRRHRNQEVLNVVNINPMELAIYQFYVVVARADDHHSQGGAWMRKTLVIDRPIAQLPVRSEGDTIKISLPHAEHMIAFQPDGAFRIHQGAGFVSVVDLGGGRLLLKAGYHRSFAFARAAMNEPEAKDRCELVALTTSLPPPLMPTFPHQGLRTTVLGSRAPLFSDFFNEDLVMAVTLRKKKWEAHLRIAAVDDP
jgi:hypothetical protein